MPDNTNVNANSAVVVVGRTAPVPPGQQKSEKSIPVVIANDQSTIPVAEQNKVQSEVALSLLGIPRSEVALGIFADVNTYDVNPTEWSADPEQFSILPNTDSGYAAIPGSQAWGLSHVPAEAGALVEAPADKNAILTSKRFFRYQPGRVSAATFGVKTSTIQDPGSSSSNFASSGSNNSVNGSNVANNAVLNPSVRKYGIFDKYDGYYWETRNNGNGDNFCVVRRTQSITYENPLVFGVDGDEQTQDYARTNPQDPFKARPSESEIGVGDSTTSPAGYSTQKKFGDLCILRDNLLMTHGGVFDPSLLQDEHKCSITQVAYGATDPVFTFGAGGGDNTTGIAVSISNAVYDETTGIMVVTTHKPHGFKDGKYLTLAGIAMTCEYSYTGSYTSSQLTSAGIATQTGAGTGNGKGVLVDKFVKTYPNNRTEYNIIEVPSSTTFKINVGVSTVPTFYKENGWAVALSKGQYVSYSKGVNAGIITGLVDTQIYKVRNVGINTGTGIVTCTFNQLSATGTGAAVNWGGDGVAIPKGEVALRTVGHNSGNENTIGITSHYMITPVPFIQPVVGTAVSALSGASNGNRYGSNNLKTNDKVLNSMGTGMFPYMYKSTDGQDKEGYIDTTINPAVSPGDLKMQIDCVNDFYDKWVNQNVKKDYWNVYEYRVPRSRFSGDRLDSATDNLLYSDSVGTNTPGSLVRNETTNEIVTDASIWNLEFDKVTMYKIEFSWYGAVGALFLAYVPVSSGEARWVRVHHLRASNQLKIASLGNATLPITYMVYGGGNQDRFGYLNNKRVALGDYLTPSEHIVKYGASYYIDGGDRGTVKLFSYATPGSVDVYGSKRTFAVGSGTQKVQVSNATDTSEPYIDLGTATGLSTSFYIGSRVVTGNPLDQNIEITYVNANKAYLNIPLNSVTIPNNTIQIKPNRLTPLIGLKCRDFIQSSTGNSVRNRTQVYPTRMSTGSDQLVKVDFLKSPKFQTDSIVTNASGPSLGQVVNIGKRGKPTKVSIPLTTYIGTHANPSHSAVSGAVVKSVATNGTETNKVAPPTSGSSYTAYDSNTGLLTIAMASGHGLTDYATTPATGVVRLKVSSISFTCSLDNNATTHTYPRPIDPIMDNDDDNVVKAGAVGTQQKDADGTWSKTLAILTATSTSITVRVTSSTTNTASAAEYIRDINTGVYGWFRGYFASDTTQKPITVFGYLENRGSDRTKNIEDDGYYFSADDSTVDDIILTTGSPFVREENSVPKDGTGTSSANTEFQLEALSSIKINPQVRSPIPGTGTVVATVYAPPGGDEYDLSPYFDYNKEYLSFPLTDSVESLYLCASSDNAFNTGTSTGYATDVGIGTISLSASLTWEEQ